MESINPIVQRYVDGWKKTDESEILDTLAEDCIIIESHGPTYRGKKIVKKWIEDWRKQGNIVEKWNINSFHTCGDLVVFEWVFAYKGKNIREAFEGVSLAKIKNNKIFELREYRATQFPFMWEIQAT
ncbi:MAG TPA: nuclear transport factor 2 family protein [Rhabdochlamydiaceae bacterium]|jgi:hypothetical protein